MSLIEELKRRKVFRVAASYAVVAFIIFQLVEILFPIFNFPQWTQQFVVIIILLGFPIALIFSWVFDKTPEGFIKTDAVKSKEKKKNEKATASKPFYLDSKNLYLLLGLVIAFLLGSYGSGSFQSSVDDKSIAVLPFDNYSTAPEDQFFSDGITEVIIANLAKVKDLKVISRTSVMEYKNTTKKIKDIAKELGVAHILEGSIQRANGRVRVVGQLIDTKTDEHIWAETYDKDETDIFELQSEVAIEIAEAMKSELTVDEKARINEKLTDSNIAYEYYLKGNMIENSGHSKENLFAAISEYERSIALDPDFAEAHAQLGKMHAHIKWYRHDLSDRRMELSKKSIDRAMELKPSNATVRIGRGTYYYHGFRDYGKALADYSLAKELEPGNISALYRIGLIYRRLGDLEKAIENITDASNLDPRSTLMINQLAGSYVSIRNYDEAIKLAKKSYEINNSYNGVVNNLIRAEYFRSGNASKALNDSKKFSSELNIRVLDFNRILKNDEVLLSLLTKSNKKSYGNILEFFPHDYFLGLAYYYKGNKKLASESFIKSIEYLNDQIILYPDDARFYTSIGIAYARLGDKQKAIEFGLKGVEVLPINKDAFFGPNHEKGLARIYSIVNEKIKALEMIEYLSSIPNGLHYGELLSDPDFDLIRDEIRFQNILLKLEPKS